MPDGTTAHRTSGTKAALAALGIVYGDLGTSPLYTYQAIVGAAGGHPSAADALGLLSLVVWTLIVTISVKYCVFVMRADNHGEGGTLALMALVSSRMNRSGLLIIMGLFGAALIYGDGIITPAISVLSALEGVNVVTDALKPYVLPASLAILLALFLVQPRGTAKYRPHLWADHAALVRHHCSARPVRCHPPTDRRDRDRSAPGVGLSDASRLAELRRTRRCLPGNHRR